MNEVTKIHLGRQAFAISVDAHQELKSYLEAIKKQVGDNEVVEEIELRMAELLAEHGINNTKVILPSDIQLLKTHLGNPKDFKEEDETSTPTPRLPDTKRLFRDTNNAMIAGVASGLAQYFGIDVLLIRILFIVAVLVTFGWAILLYIVLWLLVPEAKTSSDRLQMAGRPVNVASLKDIVERADVKGAAHRVNVSLAGPINSLYKFLLKIIGLIFILSGLSIIFGLIAAETYLLVNRSAWTQDNIFPIGLREHLLLNMAMMITGLIALFIILFGIAMFRRKWPVRAWVSGMLIGLILIGLAVGGALGSSVYPAIRDRYNANTHTSIRTLAPFTTVSVTGSAADINFQVSDTYSVRLTYYGRPDASEVKTIIRNKTLFINTDQFPQQRNCQAICIPTSYTLRITVYAPDPVQFGKQFGSMPVVPPMPVMYRP